MLYYDFPENHKKNLSINTVNHFIGDWNVTKATIQVFTFVS